MRLLKLLIATALWLAVTAVGEAAPPTGLGPTTGKVILVDFWASWCVPCRRSFPWMNGIQRKYRSAGLEIIAVNVDKERALADGFLREVPAEFALRFDPAGNLAKEFGVQTMPTSFLLDADGRVLAQHFGFLTKDAPEYERNIQEALAATRAE